MNKANEDDDLVPLDVDASTFVATLARIEILDSEQKCNSNVDNCDQPDEAF